MQGIPEPQAAEVFTKLFYRAFSEFGQITTFRNAAIQGLPLSNGIMRNMAKAFVQEQIRLGNEGFLKDASEYVQSGEDKRFHEIVLKGFNASFSSVLDASTLVFCQAIVDAFVFSLLQLSIRFDPERWREEAFNAKLDAYKVDSLGLDGALQDYLQIHLEKKNIERESIKIKLNLLFSKCKDPNPAPNIRDYVFSLDRILELDKARHKVVHETASGFMLPNGQNDVDYLLKTIFFLMALFSITHNLKMDFSMFGDGRIFIAEGEA